jgi:DNA modification methylase
VDLVVTSPPYPMVAMWDLVFSEQDPEIGDLLQRGDGEGAFGRMHGLLDRAWDECDRVLKPGGMVCVNIGDATRSLADDFRLYTNHARVLSAFQARGYAVLPDILWRKPTNAPNKFLGSGMLPVGAYVTYEHEYILVLRKGPRRRFDSPEARQRRRRSAFFWEERNVWFSDVWLDIRGTPQHLPGQAERQRSAAFPVELAYRLICMFSVQGDHILDPFAGTGTTLVAALAAGREATGVEREAALAAVCRRALEAAPGWARGHAQARLERHRQHVADRQQAGRPIRYTSNCYGFAVTTRQEVDLCLPMPRQGQWTATGDYEAEYEVPTAGPGTDAAG